MENECIIKKHATKIDNIEHFKELLEKSTYINVAKASNDDYILKLSNDNKDRPTFKKNFVALIPDYLYVRSQTLYFIYPVNIYKELVIDQIKNYLLQFDQMYIKFFNENSINDINIVMELSSGLQNLVEDVDFLEMKLNKIKRIFNKEYIEYIAIVIYAAILQYINIDCKLKFRVNYDLYSKLNYCIQQDINFNKIINQNTYNGKMQPSVYDFYGNSILRSKSGITFAPEINILKCFYDLKI